MVNVWRNQNPCALLVVMLSGSAAIENSMADLKKIKQNYHKIQQDSLLGEFPKELKRIQTPSHPH